MGPNLHTSNALPADEGSISRSIAVSSRAGRSLSGIAVEARRLWDDKRVRLIVGVALAALYGLVAGLVTPRGPMTSAAALAAMATSVGIGVVAGMATRSRGAMLWGPLAFVAVFELARLDAVGPTVDGLHLGSEYGLIAFVVGRGFHGAVVIAVMILAASFGAGIARRRHPSVVPRSGWRTAGVVARRAIAGLTTIALVVLAVGLARPASTAPILGSRGELLPGSVAELSAVAVNGHDLSLVIRGQSAANPVLLYLAGGPGGSDVGGMRAYLQALERDFVVVTWDQRGTGTSYAQLEPTSTLTFAGAVDDTVAVTQYLQQRFQGGKVFLVGNSYGTLLGVRAVQQRPDLFAAFVGTGQMVDVAETDRTIYVDTLAWARSKGNTSLVDQLATIGPPPYADILNYEAALSHLDEVYPYDHTPNAEGAGGFSSNLTPSEYTLVDTVHAFGGFLDTFAAIYPGMQDIDLRKDATTLSVPVYVVEGRFETHARSDLAHEWFAGLQAPYKELIVLDTSGHRSLFEQPDRFVQVMSDVLARSRT